MGHIELASPVAHIWFLKSLPSRIGLLTDMILKDLEKVLYFESFIVTEPGLTSLNKGQIISEEEYDKYLDEFGDESFEVAIGAEAIKKLLSELDLNQELLKIKEDLEQTSSELKRKKLVKRLKLVESFLSSGSAFENSLLAKRSSTFRIATCTSSATPNPSTQQSINLLWINTYTVTLKFRNRSRT